MSTATINHPDEDVQKVAAALADARIAGGLSLPYFRAADEALKRLAERLQPNPVPASSIDTERPDADADWFYDEI